MGKKKKTTNRDKLMEEKINGKINELEKEIKEYIKDKGIMENEKVGQKIDVLVKDREFIHQLKGNSNPGVFEKLRDNEKNIKEIKEFNKKIKGNGEIGIFEQLRSIERQIKRIKTVLCITIILWLGGSYFGITGAKIKEKIFGIKSTEKKQIEENKKDIELIENESIKIN